jgi:hypothetical protein
MPIAFYLFLFSIFSHHFFECPSLFFLGEWLFSADKKEWYVDTASRNPAFLRFTVLLILLSAAENEKIFDIDFCFDSFGLQRKNFRTMVEWRDRI